MFQAKIEIGQTRNCLGKTRTAHNLLEKFHISASTRINLVVTNLIWEKP